MFSLPSPSSDLKVPNRKLRKQRWRRATKTWLKMWICATLNFIALIPVQFVKCWQIILALNSKRGHQSSGEEKERRCLVFTSSTKREISVHFHVEVVQRRQRNAQKSVMHVPIWPYCFLPFSLTSPLTLLKLSHKRSRVTGDKADHSRQAGLPSYCSNTLLHEKSGEKHPSKISLCSKTTTKGAYYNISHIHIITNWPPYILCALTFQWLPVS